MGRLIRFGLLTMVSLAWIVPGIEAFQILDRVHALEVSADPATLRDGLEAVKWCLAAMAVASAVWAVQFLGARQSAAERALLMSGVHETQRRLEADVDRLSEALRHNTASLQTDFGNFTTVGTRLRSALETRLNGIEDLLQRPASAQHESSQALAIAMQDVAQRLQALAQATEHALGDLRMSVKQELRGLHGEIQARDERALTDFDQLGTRLSYDADRWSARLQGLERSFAELTRKTALDNAQLTANLKLLSLRLKEMAVAVQH